MNRVASPTRELDLDALSGRLPTAFICSGCGYHLPEDEPVRPGCPTSRAGDDIDHVLRRVLAPSRLAFPVGDEPNPFVRYRTLLHAYHSALAAGWSDGDVVDFIERLDHDLARVDGAGFRITPFERSDTLSERLGFAGHAGVWVKDETGNVSGSHKARHLFGTLLELEMAGGPSTAAPRPLAIASCGNAALAAAVVARSVGRRLQVFVPEVADPEILDRLRDLDAEVTICERQPGSSGDPTYRRLAEAIAKGAVPFTCQGNLNGLAIEGGETLGWEIVSQLASANAHLDRLFIQVGGGALAASIIGGLTEARELGALRALPRIHTVQTRGAFPLARAFERLVARLGPVPTVDEIEQELARAARHRSEYMWPWETEPHSVAEGILDDETYDWLAVVRGMLLTGGSPLIVDEATLRTANEIGRETTGIDVSVTGSAGLAGLLDLTNRGEIDPGETVAVIFTGVRRSGDQS